MTHNKRKRFASIPMIFRRFRNLFGGYLHEDFVEEYGSAAEAVKIFLSDASGDEIQQCKRRVATSSYAITGQAVRRELSRRCIGSGTAWHPTSHAELDGARRNSLARRRRDILIRF